MESSLGPWGLQLRVLGCACSKPAPRACIRGQGASQGLLRLAVTPCPIGGDGQQGGWRGSALGWDVWHSSGETAVARRSPRSVEALDGARRIAERSPPTCYQVEGQSGALCSSVLGFPLAPGQGQGPTVPLCREVAFEKVCPPLWEGAFAVRAVHGIFSPVIQPRQDLVHKFSRGNAFDKNLMGSGRSAESPYEFQVFVWSLAWAGAQPRAANGLFSRGPWNKDPPPDPTSPGRCRPESGGPLRGGVKPWALESSGNHKEMWTLDT